MGEPIYNAYETLRPNWPRQMTSVEWGNYLNGMMMPINPSELVNLIRRILQDLYQREQEAQFWQQRAEFAEEVRIRYYSSPMPIYFPPFLPDYPTRPLTSPIEEKKEEHKKKRIIRFEE